MPAPHVAWRWLALAAACLGLAGPPSHAASLRYCDRAAPLTAGQQDKLFRFGALIKSELDKVGAAAVLLSRSGLDLSRFGLRYSHAGVSLRDSPNTPWSVRQLYYACDEQRPRIFDQGMLGFVMGTDDPVVGYVSVVWVPADAAEPLARSAQDKALALQLLGRSYSANAYAFSTTYQNCNQWLMELLATAWGGLNGPTGLREQAQQWLQAQAYLPSVIDLGNPLLQWLGAFVPWVHSDDHPAPDLAALTYRVSMPASMEAFVKARLPGARRLEFCHNERHLLVHQGWSPIAEGCVAAEGDQVIPLE